MTKRTSTKRATKRERRASEDAWIEEQTRSILRGSDSYGRIYALIDARPWGCRPGAAWFRLLGVLWSSCDGVAGVRGFLKRTLHQASRTQLDAMMTDEERRRLAEMPDIIRAFRGCEAEDREGFSFSLCERVARKFPFLNRYEAKIPALIVADIPKERAVLKMDRNEEEIIACGAFSIVAIEIIEGENSPPDGSLRQNPPSVSSTMPG